MKRLCPILLTKWVSDPLLLMIFFTLLYVKNGNINPDPGDRYAIFFSIIPFQPDCRRIVDPDQVPFVILETGY